MNTIKYDPTQYQYISLVKGDIPVTFYNEYPQMTEDEVWEQEQAYLDSVASLAEAENEVDTLLYPPTGPDDDPDEEDVLDDEDDDAYDDDTDDDDDTF